MVIDFNEILKSLPSLNRKELELLRQRIQVLLQYKNHSNVLEDEDWVLSGIFTELKRRGLYTPSDNFRIKKASSFASFQTKSQKVRGLLEMAAPSLNRLEKKLLGEVCAYELANYVNWKDISLNSLLESIDKIPMAIERSFPGYLANGMLAVIIQHKFSL